MTFFSSSGGGGTNPTYDPDEDGVIDHGDLAGIGSGDHHAKASTVVDSGTVSVSSPQFVGIDDLQTVTVSHNVSSPVAANAGFTDNGNDEYTHLTGVTNITSSSIVITYHNTHGSSKTIAWRVGGIS